MSAAVEVHALTKRHGSVIAADQVSWQAHAGAVTAVLGPNGAGKTTTMECLEGLQRPDAGTARVLGSDPWHAGDDHRARVGVMLQDGGLPNGAAPTALVRHMARLYARPADVDELIARLGIDTFARTPVRRLSGGQRQRLALAVALVGDPEVLFLDEPTAGLDPHARLDVWDIVRERRDAGVSVVVTTHSFEEAERLADHVVIMGAGHVLREGPLNEVRGPSGLEDVYFDLTGRTHR